MDAVQRPAHRNVPADRGSVLGLALLLLCAAPATSAATSVAGGHVRPHDVDPGTAVAAGNEADPCARTLLRPQPCPLWHAPAYRPDLAVGTPEGVGARQSSVTTNGLGLLAVAFVAAALLDENVRQYVAAEDPDNPMAISRIGNVLGNGRSALIVTSATWGASSLLGHDRLADPAGRVLVSLMAAGVANGALKTGLGRARPRLDRGPSEFRPFSLDNGWQSFPSGHTVTAFALATAISAEADRAWVTALTYSAAGLVAWSRSHEDFHWASDVVAGAALGTVVAHYTSRRLQARAEPLPPPGNRLVIRPHGLGVKLLMP